MKELKIRIENLKKAIESAEVEKGKVQTKRYNLEKLKNESLLDVLEYHIRPLLDTGDVIRGGSESFEVIRREGDYNRNICDIYIRKGWSNKEFKLEMNYGSTRMEDLFEFNRVITLGKITEVMLNNKSGVIRKFENIHDDYKDELKDYGTFIFEADKQIKSLNETITDCRHDISLIKLTSKEGYDMENGELDFASKGYFTNVTNVKMIDVSKSGKTCNLEITNTIEEYSYNTNKSTSRPYTRIIENINVSRFMESFRYSHTS